MQNTHHEVAPRPLPWRAVCLRHRTPRGPGHRPESRSGYVLVECLVSLVLLAGAAALLQLIAAATSAGVDRAIQSNHALETVDVVHQRWLRIVCTPGGGNVEGLVPSTSTRLVVDVAAVADGALHRLTIRAAWGVSSIGAGPLGASRQVQRELSAAARCDP